MKDKKYLIKKLVKKAQPTHEEMQRHNANFWKNFLIATALGTTLGAGGVLIPSFLRRNLLGKSKPSQLTIDPETAVLSDIIRGKTLPNSGYTATAQSWKTKDEDEEEDDETSTDSSSRTGVKEVNLANPILSFRKSSGDLLKQEIKRRYIEKSANNNSGTPNFTRLMYNISGDPVFAYPTYMLGGALGLFLGKQFGTNFLRKTDREEQAAIHEEVRERYRKQLKEVLRSVDNDDDDDDDRGKNLKFGSENRKENNLEKRSIFSLFDRAAAGIDLTHKTLRYFVPGAVAAWLFYRTANRLAKQREEPIQDLVDKIQLQRDFSVDTIPEDVDIALREYQEEKKKRKRKNI